MTNTPFLLTTVLVLTWASTAPPDQDLHVAHARLEATWPVPQAAPDNRALPADEQGAARRLAASPRRGEFVAVDIDGKPLTIWIVYPDRTERAPVVIVIQEIFGLSDWVRGVADQLAAEGFIAVAPDLISGYGPNGGDTRSMATRDEIMQATNKLSGMPGEIISKLKAARAYGLSRPFVSGRSASVGFCYGGNLSFELAIAEPVLDAAVVFYGSAPGTWKPPAPGTFIPSDALARITAPVLGLYAEDDRPLTPTLAPTAAKLKELGKSYESHTFEGASHAFLREQSGHDGANLKAAQRAWPLMITWLRKHTT